MAPSLERSARSALGVAVGRVERSWSGPGSPAHPPRALLRVRGPKLESNGELRGGGKQETISKNCCEKEAVFSRVYRAPPGGSVANLRERCCNDGRCHPAPRVHDACMYDDPTLHGIKGRHRELRRFLGSLFAIIVRDIYMRSAVNLVVRILLIDRAIGHAVMTKPTPRNGTQIGSGIKLTPFSAARTIANSGCGGPDNMDPGTGKPVATYQSGASVQVEWKLTVPHPADHTLNGVRVAVHFAAGDSFEQNILAGGVEGDPDVGSVPAGGPKAESDSLQTVAVNLPAGKTCVLCTLQWVWSAQEMVARTLVVPTSPSPQTDSR